MKAFSIHKPVVFLIITILGSLSAMLADAFGGWVLAAGFLAVSAMLLIGNLVQFGKDEIDPGLTTEMAGLVMFAVGAALIKGYTVPAIAVSGVVAVLLQWKQHLQKFVDKISGCDFKAIIQLAAAAPLGVLMGLRRSLISRNTHKKKLKMRTLNPSTHSVRQILTQFIDIYALPNPVIMLVDMPGVSKAEVAEFRDQTYTERAAHFGVRKYFQVVIFLIICLSVSSASVAWGHNEKIDGYFFGDYYYLPKSHRGELEKRNGFQYRRVYFTYEKDLSTEFSTRFRLEMNGKSFPTARQTTSKLEPFLKHGYLKWKPSGWRTNIYLGLSGTPTWRNVEKAWGYRSVAKTVLDLHKMGSSTDFGIALQGDIDASNQISYHLMIANGTGTRAEIDKNKRSLSHSQPSRSQVLPLRDMLTEKTRRIWANGTHYKAFSVINRSDFGSVFSLRIRHGSRGTWIPLTF